MKYCLNSRQEDKYLQKADEIYFNAADNSKIPEYAEKYPNAILIMEYILPLSDEELLNYRYLTKDRLVIAGLLVPLLDQAKRLEIPFYYLSYINSIEQANALVDFGVSYLKIDAPLFFSLKDLSKLKTKVRLTPNLAHKDNLPRKNGVSGSWVRPEDMDFYENYIYICEFEDSEVDKVKYLQRERALFRIYAKDKKWLGDLNDIIADLNYPAKNQTISPIFGRYRLNCGQACENGGSCRICYRLLDIADSSIIESFINKLKTPLE